MINITALSPDQAPECTLIRVEGRHTTRIALLCTTLLWLSACETTDDPREGGFVSGAINIADGGYQRRVDEKQREYDEQLAARQNLVRQAEELKQERIRLTRELEQATKRLTELEVSIREQRRRLEQEHRLTAEAQVKLKKLRDAEARARRIRSAADQLDPGDNSLGALQEKVTELSTDLAELDSIVDSLAGEGF